MSENMTTATTTTAETQPHDGGRITYFHGQGSLDELDEETLLKQSPFPIKPDDLIALTKHVLNDNLLCPEAHLKCGPALSEDFQYWSFAVGPINKKSFIEYLKMNLTDAFPDRKMNTFGYRVDPMEFNRVWFNARWQGTHTGMLMNKIKPTYKQLDLPPQIVSLTFTEEGKVSKYTQFVADRSCGNTHGYSGVFGIFRALGENVPFPGVVENYLRKDSHRRSEPGVYFKLRAWFWQRKVTRRTNRRSEKDTGNERWHR